jgi:hypothetical protein
MNNPSFSGAAGSGNPSTLLYMNHGTYAYSGNIAVNGTEFFHFIEMDILLFKKDMFVS